MCDSTGRYEETGGALAAPGGPQSLFIPAQDALPRRDGCAQKHGEKQGVHYARCLNADRARARCSQRQSLTREGESMPRDLGLGFRIQNKLTK